MKLEEFALSQRSKTKDKLNLKIYWRILKKDNFGRYRPTKKIIFAKIDYRLCGSGGSLDPPLECEITSLSGPARLVDWLASYEQAFSYI